MGIKKYKPITPGQRDCLSNRPRSYIMSIIRKKPTSPGVRFVVEVSRPILHKGQPYAALIEKKNSTGGRTH